MIKPGVKREITMLFTVLFIVFLLGLLAGEVFIFLFIALFVYVGWSLYNLNQLSKWLANPKKDTPEVYGVWDEVYYQLYHMYKRQRSARRKLSSILNRFQESTQALPYATVVMNERNEIEWFNPAAKQMFNLHAKIDIGQRLDNLLRQPKFSKYLREKDFTEPVEFLINQNKYVLNITPYGSGQFLVSARDITARSKLDDMRRDFVSNASHELRTPLTVINGYIEFLQDKENDKTKAPLEKVQQQLTRMNKIIAELIELARLESSEPPDTTTSVDVNKLLSEIYNDALTLDQGEHHIELLIEGNTEKDNKLQLSGSYDELRMAFSNLVNNAIRYTQEDGEIYIIARSNESGISVYVEDTGQGIEYEHIPRLTERFYRVDEGRSRDKGGTGLGLAIVKHVLDRHQSNLHIQSIVGKGTIFRCDFPLSYN